MALLRHTGIGLSPRAGDGFPPPPPRGQALRGNDGSGALQSIFVPTTEEGCGAAILVVMTGLGAHGSELWGHSVRTTEAIGS